MICKFQCPGVRIIKEVEAIGDDKEENESPDRKKQKLDEGTKRKSETDIAREAAVEKKQGFRKKQAEKTKRQYEKMWT